VFSLIWASVVRFTALAPAVETHGRYSVAGWLFTTAGDLHLSRSIAGLSAPMVAAGAAASHLIIEFNVLNACLVVRRVSLRTLMMKSNSTVERNLGREILHIAKR
jgi:hypothetical protein